jgi:pimeloyl-ACP methyl ester carboxylesterase
VAGRNAGPTDECPDRDRTAPQNTAPPPSPLDGHRPRWIPRTLDVTAAISLVLELAGVTRGVGVLGLSMGGEVGLTVAAMDHRVGALVVEGASARTWADARLEPDPKTNAA